MEEAATKLQSAFRGHMARKQYKHQNAPKDENDGSLLPKITLIPKTPETNEAKKNKSEENIKTYSVFSDEEDNNEEVDEDMSEMDKEIKELNKRLSNFTQSSSSLSPTKDIPSKENLLEEKTEEKDGIGEELNNRLSKFKQDNLYLNSSEDASVSQNNQHPEENKQEANEERDEATEELNKRLSSLKQSNLLPDVPTDANESEENLPCEENEEKDEATEELNKRLSGLKQSHLLSDLSAEEAKEISQSEENEEKDEATEELNKRLSSLKRSNLPSDLSAETNESKENFQNEESKEKDETTEELNKRLSSYKQSNLYSDTSCDIVPLKDCKPVEEKDEKDEESEELNKRLSNYKQSNINSDSSVDVVPSKEDLPSDKKDDIKKEIDKRLSEKDEDVTDSDVLQMITVPQGIVPKNEDHKEEKNKNSVVDKLDVDYSSSKYDVKDKTTTEVKPDEKAVEELSTIAYKIGAGIALQDDTVLDVLNQKSASSSAKKEAEFIHIPLKGPLPEPKEVTEEVIEKKTSQQLTKSDSGSVEYIHIPLKAPGDKEEIETISGKSDPSFLSENAESVPRNAESPKVYELIMNKNSYIPTDQIDTIYIPLNRRRRSSNLDTISSTSAEVSGEAPNSHKVVAIIENDGTKNRNEPEENEDLSSTISSSATNTGTMNSSAETLRLDELEASVNNIKEDKITPSKNDINHDSITSEKDSKNLGPPLKLDPGIGLDSADSSDFSQEKPEALKEEIPVKIGLEVKEVAGITFCSTHTIKAPIEEESIDGDDEDEIIKNHETGEDQIDLKASSILLSDIESLSNSPELRHHVSINDIDESDLDSFGTAAIEKILNGDSKINNTNDDVSANLPTENTSNAGANLDNKSNAGGALENGTALNEDASSFKQDKLAVGNEDLQNIASSPCGSILTIKEMDEPNEEIKSEATDDDTFSSSMEDKNILNRYTLKSMTRQYSVDPSSHRKLFDEIDTIIETYGSKKESSFTDSEDANVLSDGVDKEESKRGLVKLSEVGPLHSGELHDSVVPNEDETKAATKIQSTYRGFKARKGLLDKNKDRDSEDNNVASIGEKGGDDQGQVSPVSKRLETDIDDGVEENTTMDEDSAARKIQSLYRGFNARKQVKNQQVDSLSKGNTSKESKDCLNDEQVQKMPQLSSGNAADEEKAAIRIQSHFRGLQARRNLSTSKHVDGTNDDVNKTEGDVLVRSIGDDNDSANGKMVDLEQNIDGNIKNNSNGAENLIISEISERLDKNNEDINVKEEDKQDTSNFRESTMNSNVDPNVKVIGEEKKTEGDKNIKNLPNLGKFTEANIVKEQNENVERGIIKENTTEPNKEVVKDSLEENKNIDISVKQDIIGEKGILKEKLDENMCEKATTDVRKDSMGVDDNMSVDSLEEKKINEDNKGKDIASKEDVSVESGDAKFYKPGENEDVDKNSSVRSTASDKHEGSITNDSRNRVDSSKLGTTDEVEDIIINLQTDENISNLSIRSIDNPKEQENIQEENSVSNPKNDDMKADSIKAATAENIDKTIENGANLEDVETVNKATTEIINIALSESKVCDIKSDETEKDNVKQLDLTADVEKQNTQNSQSINETAKTAIKVDSLLSGLQNAETNDTKNITLSGQDVVTDDKTDENRSFHNGTRQDSQGTDHKNGTNIDATAESQNNNGKATSGNGDKSLSDKNIEPEAEEQKVCSPNNINNSQVESAGNKALSNQTKENNAQDSNGAVKNTDVAPLEPRNIDTSATTNYENKIFSEETAVPEVGSAVKNIFLSSQSKENDAQIGANKKTDVVTSELQNSDSKSDEKLTSSGLSMGPEVEMTVDNNSQKNDAQNSNGVPKNVELPNIDTNATTSDENKIRNDQNFCTEVESVVKDKTACENKENNLEDTNGSNKNEKNTDVVLVEAQNCDSSNENKAASDQNVTNVVELGSLQDKNLKNSEVTNGYNINETNIDSSLPEQRYLDTKTTANDDIKNLGDATDINNASGTTSGLNQSKENSQEINKSGKSDTKVDPILLQGQTTGMGVTSSIENKISNDKAAIVDVNSATTGNISGKNDPPDSKEIAKSESESKNTVKSESGRDISLLEQKAAERIDKNKNPGDENKENVVAENAAALTIQKSFRNYKKRQTNLEKDEDTFSATSDEINELLQDCNILELEEKLKKDSPSDSAQLNEDDFDDPEINNAAIKIQSTYRGFRTRREVQNSNYGSEGLETIPELPHSKNESESDITENEENDRVIGITDSSPKINKDNVGLKQSKNKDSNITEKVTKNYGRTNEEEDNTSEINKENADLKDSNNKDDSDMGITEKEKETSNSFDTKNETADSSLGIKKYDADLEDRKNNDDNDSGIAENEEDKHNDFDKMHVKADISEDLKDSKSKDDSDSNTIEKEGENVKNVDRTNEEANSSSEKNADLKDNDNKNGNDSIIPENENEKRKDSDKTNGKTNNEKDFDKTNEKDVDLKDNENKNDSDSGIAENESEKNNDFDRINGKTNTSSDINKENGDLRGNDKEGRQQDKNSEGK